MESLGHTGLRTKVNGHSWSTLKATFEMLQTFWTTKRLWEGWSMVSAGLCYHSHFKLNFAMTYQLEVWNQVGTTFARLKPSRFFYLWGYLKDNVYENNHQTISEIKRATTRRIKRISLKECVWVIDSFANRIHVCLQHPGVHLEYILERHDSKTVLNLCLKFCAKFVHKKKFINNKYFFFVCCSIVTFIKIFIGGIFFLSPCNLKCSSVFMSGLYQLDVSP